MADITPGETNTVPIGTDVFGAFLNNIAIVNYVLLVRSGVGHINAIEAVGGPGVGVGSLADGPGGAGVIARGGDSAQGGIEYQPPGPGVIGQAGAGGDADGVRGNGSGSFSGVAGFADSGATANSGIHADLTLSVARKP